MRIAMLAAGSRGDYQPVLAVARGLQARGHEVGVTATSDYLPMVTGAGVRAEEVAVDVMGYYRDHALRDGMPTGLLGQMDLLGEVARVMAPAVRETLTDLWPRYDAVVTTAMSSAWPGLIGGPRKPQVLMMFVAALPSVWGDVSLYSERTGRSIHNLVSGLRAMGPSARLATTDGSSTPRERLRGLTQLATAPAFVANSAQIITPRRIGGRQIRSTGYPFLDLPAELGREVAAFLDGGSAPVYVGLGSHTVPTVRQALAHTVSAALDLGHRAIVQRGSGLEDLEHGDRVLFVDEVPHELLFPRCVSVVHHGGAGTTAQALRAGRPQVVLPFTMDQPFFARRVHEIGVGSAPVPITEATPARLLAALETALDPALTRRARSVGQVVRGEDGVGGAVAVIEAELGRQPASPKAATRRGGQPPRRQRTSPCGVSAPPPG
ncbi:glycosyltransferase family 1 protein [Ornithinimicrobium ciconiae]|uniref:Glycosyltransferase family 1 protein n=1 Tax=Ornithinimicrobium ciconiae TaxID=2594265 RepID=A0A516G9Q1_9MICO|nr:glycosyltransferase [Ornithinimicrobium ciconiae]QDO88215.1 glycosyltransferase family 1 protein [Ornithinimicrobium ciconiae]